MKLLGVAFAAVSVAASLVLRYRRLSTVASGVDLQELWAACISGWRFSPDKAAFVVPYRPGAAWPLPEQIVNHTVFSLGGWNPHGQVVNTTENLLATASLKAALSSLSTPPSWLVDSLSFDGGATWLERGFSLGYNNSEHSPEDIARIQAEVLALALKFKQSGVFRYTACHDAAHVASGCILQTMLATDAKYDSLGSQSHVMIGARQGDHPSLSRPSWSYVFHSHREAAAAFLEVSQQLRFLLMFYLVHALVTTALREPRHFLSCRTLTTSWLRTQASRVT